MSSSRNPVEVTQELIAVLQRRKRVANETPHALLQLVTEPPTCIDPGHIERTPLSSKKWVTPNEIEEEFGFSRWKAYRLFHEELPTFKIGSNLLVRREDFNQWLESQRFEPVGEGGSRDGRPPIR